MQDKIAIYLIDIKFTNIITRKKKVLWYEHSEIVMKKYKKKTEEVSKITVNT